MKKILSLLLALVFVFALVSCSSTNSETQVSESAEVSAEPSEQPLPSESETESDADTSQTEPETSSDETILFTDSAGREVEVPGNITRIAASGAMAQIVIFALAPDALVGIASEWSDDAAQYLDEKYYDLTVFGQFYGSGDLNLEEIAAQAPQVIIDVGEAKSTIVEDMDAIMEQVGIPTIHIDAATGSMGDAYRMLGELLGMEDEAEVLAQYCESVVTRTEEIVNQIGEDGKTSLIYCIGTDGLSVLAETSYHAEIIDLIADNAAVVDEPSSKGSGNQIDMEQLLIWNPEVILFAPDSVYDTVATDDAWMELDAIKNGSYYEVPFGPYNWMGFPPSVNRYLGMIWMAQLLYPETAQYDMYEEAAQYYELFYHCSLSEAQYNELVAKSLG